MQLPPSDSTALALQAKVGPTVKAVSPSRIVSRHRSSRIVHHKLPCDVLACSDDKDARPADQINGAYKIPDDDIAIAGLE